MYKEHRVFLKKMTSCTKIVDDDLTIRYKLHICVNIKKYCI